MNVAIVGATGYGGIQAVNLLKKNKKYKISFLGGNKTSGSMWNDVFPFIYLENDPCIEKISVENIASNADVALLCLPNGLSYDNTIIKAKKSHLRLEHWYIYVISIHYFHKYLLCL